MAKLESREQLLQILQAQPNDLEAPAIALQPVIADVLKVLHGFGGCQLLTQAPRFATIKPGLGRPLGHGFDGSEQAE